MKGRQRTLLDTFWRDPQYSSLSTEDKFCLIYLSTCSYSNMIGVYTFVASIMAAEAGWDTCSQLWPVLERLEAKNYVEIDRSKSIIWVKMWWDNNTASTLLNNPKLRDKALNQIRSIPSHWQESFISTFLSLQDRDSSIKWFLNQELNPCLADRLKRLEATEDETSPEKPEVATSLTRPDTRVRNEIAKIVSRSKLPDEDMTGILEQISKLQEKGSTIRSPIAYATQLVKLAQAGTFVKPTSA